MSPFLRHAAACRRFLAAVGLVLALPAAALPLGLAKIGEVVPHGREATFLGPSAIWFDGFRDNLLVANTEANRILVLDRHGGVRKIIGQAGDLRLPRVLAADRQGNLYVVERGSELLKVLPAYDAPGEGQWRLLDLAPFRQTRPVEPIALFPAEDGLLVADRGNRRILALDRDGNLRQAISRIGEPSDIWALPGKIIIADPAFGGIGIFSENGRRLGSLGDDPARFPEPLRGRALVVDRRERLWTIEESGRIRSLDMAGNSLLVHKDTALFTPTDLALDPEGNLYVLDRGGNRITVFRVTEF